MPPMKFFFEFRRVEKFAEPVVFRLVLNGVSSYPTTTPGWNAWRDGRRVLSGGKGIGSLCAAFVGGIVSGFRRS